MVSRILVLEPDSMRQLAIRAALASAGYRAITVADATAAASELGLQAFELVLIGPEVPSNALAHIQAAPPLVRLTVLPDCVVGETSGPPPRELAAILEALTRYFRFAPLRAEQHDLLQEWASYELKGD